MEDNLLDMEDYDLLESTIDNPFFPWFFQKEQVKDDDPFFCHALYCNDLVQSKFYKPILDIFKKYIKWIALYRMNINLLCGVSFKGSVGGKAYVCINFI